MSQKLFKVIKQAGFKCGHCDAAVEMLEAAGVDFVVEAIPGPDLHVLAQKHDWRTVPMVFHGENFIGGRDALSVYLTQALDAA